MPTLLHPHPARLTVAVAATGLVGAQVAHELGHWLVASLHGWRPVWGLTAVVQLPGPPPSTDGWSRYIDSSGDSTWIQMESLPDSRIDWFGFLISGPAMQLMVMALGYGLVVSASSKRVRTAGALVAAVNGLSLGAYELVSLLRGGGGDERLLGEHVGGRWWFFAVVFGITAVAGLIGVVARIDRGDRFVWLTALLVGTIATGPAYGHLQTLIVESSINQGLMAHPILGVALLVWLLATGALAVLAWLLTTWPPTESTRRVTR